MSSYFLYILQCVDKTLYTGITVDVERRVFEHNHSSRGAKYTSAKRPVRLVYAKKFSNKSAALKAERKIKALSRSEKLTLVKSQPL